MYIISILLHPLGMPVYLLLLVTFVFPELLSPLPPAARQYFMLLIFTCTFVIPAISMVVFRNSGWISSYSIEKREERIVPFLFVAMIYGVTTFMVMNRLDLNALIITILFSTTTLLLLLTLITYFYKISIHNAAAWGTSGFLMGIYIKSGFDSFMLYTALGFILLSGVTGTARLYLGAHTPNQVWYGSLLGFGICFSAILWFA